MYAVGVQALVEDLKNVEEVIQNWYADDSSAARKFEGIRRWFELSIEKGPKYGYFPNQVKE